MDFKKTLTLFFILSLISDTLIAQYFSNDVLFDKTYGVSQTAQETCELPNGNTVVIGYMSEVLQTSGMSANVLTNAHLSVHNPAGDVIGSYTYGRTNVLERFYGVIPCDNSQDEVMVIGYVKNLNNDLDIWVLRINTTTGNVLHHQVFDIDQEDQVPYTIVSEDGQSDRYIISGNTVVSNNTKIFAIKVDFNCQLLWDRIYGSNDPADNTTVHSMVFDSYSGNYIIAGKITEANGSGYSKVFALSINKAGNVVIPYKTYAINTNNDFDVSGNVYIASLKNNQFVITFTATDIDLISGTIVFPALFKLNNDLSLAWNHCTAYIRPGQMYNLAYQLYENSIIQGYDMAIFNTHNASEVGFLATDVNGRPLHYIRYDIHNMSSTSSMHQGKSGYYVKTYTAYNSSEWGYSLIGVDDRGAELYSSCYTTEDMQSQDFHIEKLDRQTPIIPSHALSSMISFETASKSGDTYDCNGNKKSFKSNFNMEEVISSDDHLSSKNKSEIKIFPSVLNTEDEYLNIQIHSTSSENISIKVYDQSGHLNYIENRLINEGQNRLKIKSENFAKGMNALEISSKTGIRFIKKIVNVGR